MSCTETPISLCELCWNPHLIMRAVLKPPSHYVSCNETPSHYVSCTETPSHYVSCTETPSHYVSCTETPISLCELYLNPRLIMWAVKEVKQTSSNVTIKAGTLIWWCLHVSTSQGAKMWKLLTSLLIVCVLGKEEFRGYPLLFFYIYIYFFVCFCFTFYIKQIHTKWWQQIVHFSKLTWVV